MATIKFTIKVPSLINPPAQRRYSFEVWSFVVVDLCVSILKLYSVVYRSQIILVWYNFLKISCTFRLLLLYNIIKYMLILSMSIMGLCVPLVCPLVSSLVQTFSKLIKQGQGWSRGSRLVKGMLRICFKYTSSMLQAGFKYASSRLQAGFKQVSSRLQVSFKYSSSRFK